MCRRVMNMFYNYLVEGDSGELRRWNSVSKVNLLKDSLLSEIIMTEQGRFFLMPGTLLALQRWTWSTNTWAYDCIKWTNALIVQEKSNHVPFPFPIPSISRPLKYSYTVVTHTIALFNKDLLWKVWKLQERTSQFLPGTWVLGRTKFFRRAFRALAL